jgi:D-alanyl-D-alanine carboxypeptidase (penicillin-binding protein 5/6)
VATNALLGVLLLMLSLGALLTPGVTLAQDEPDLGISAQRYIVIDADTGEVFAQRNASDRAALASLTKMFTMIEAIERAPLNFRITTDSSDLFDASSTTMGFGPGETFTLEELLYGMMLPSGNDAAHAIARTLGAQDGDTPAESVDRFMSWVNERVRNMGLIDTNLVNPHGLGVPNHYSTVRDIAAFGRYALLYPAFTEVAGTFEFTTSNGYSMTNTNRLLNMYPDLIAGKTGYDDDAGYCLIQVAKRNGSTMISVTLDGVAPDVWYQDNVILLDYAFERKAARLAAAEPIGADLVTFRDPDAARVQAIMTPGASLGEPETPVPAATPTPVAVASPAPEPQTSTSGGGSSDQASWRMFGVIVALVVVLGAVAIGRVARGSPRSPGPTAPDG